MCSNYLLLLIIIYFIYYFIHKIHPPQTKDIKHGFIDQEGDFNLMGSNQTKVIQLDSIQGG